MERSEVLSLIFKHISRNRRLVIGIAGTPGSGKSTLAAGLVAELQAEIPACVVSMDGWHYSNAVLEKMGLRSRKGCPESFDAEKFVKFVSVIKSCEYARYPLYSRMIHDPIPGGVIRPETRVVIVEGLYIFLNRDPWRKALKDYDLKFFTDAPDEDLMERLIRRKMRAGKTADEGRYYANKVDIPNAALIRSESVFTGVIRIK